MAGKKKKPAANPARGFATTSVASKPRPEAVNPESKPAQQPGKPISGVSPSAKQDAPPSGSAADTNPEAGQAAQEKPLSPEEFERQLQESELQLLVEKYSQKIKRDALRQRSRLDTDRRLLRVQADSVNSIKWLPPELMDQVLDLVQAEGRFATAGLSSENASAGKMPSEEDMITKLWTLQHTLLSAAFPQDRVHAVIQHILDIAPSVSSPAKDSIWGLEEAFDWLARECAVDELPPYEPKAKPVSRGLYITLPHIPSSFLMSIQKPLATVLSRPAPTPLDSPNPPVHARAEAETPMAHYRKRHSRRSSW
jgi:ATP-dependent RNA helicase DHX29